MDMRNKLFAPLLLAVAAPTSIFAAMPSAAVAADPDYRVGFEQAAIPDPGHARDRSRGHKGKNQRGCGGCQEQRCEQLVSHIHDRSPNHVSN